MPWRGPQEWSNVADHHLTKVGIDSNEQFKPKHRGYGFQPFPYGQMIRRFGLIGSRSFRTRPYRAISGKPACNRGSSARLERQQLPASRGRLFIEGNGPASPTRSRAAPNSR